MQYNDMYDRPHGPSTQGPDFMNILSLASGSETFVSKFWNNLLEPMGSELMDFTNGLSLSFGGATG